MINSKEKLVKLLKEAIEYLEELEKDILTLQGENIILKTSNEKLKQQLYGTLPGRNDDQG